MSDYDEACVMLGQLRWNTSEAFDLGEQLLQLADEAGLPAPVVSEHGLGGGAWVMRFGPKGRSFAAWVGLSGGIDLRPPDDPREELSIVRRMVRNQTPEQAVAWLKERVK